MEAAGCQLPGKSSWIILGVGQTGNVVLEAAVARLRQEHSPSGGASSWKSTGTDRSQPSLLGEEPWHQVQTRIFPSPASAAAQTADGIAQTLPSPFSPAIATLCSWISPENTLGLGPPSAARMGVTPPSVGSPPAPHSPALRALIPWWLQAQACGASAGDAEQTCRSVSMLRIIWRKGLTAPPVPGGKTLGRCLRTQGR